MEHDALVVVVRRTRMEELLQRFGTRGQARFYLEQPGQPAGRFREYEEEHDRYRSALDVVLRALELGLKLQVIDRELVPTYLFGPRDLIVTVGQDGLVANTARYAQGRPIVAINPDPERFDGVLLPFSPSETGRTVERVLSGRARLRNVTLAQARLSDGQSLIGFNDLYLGARTHVSARYRIRRSDDSGAPEAQSSSGVLVCTGAGSTGWLSSVINMQAGVATLCAELEGGARARPTSGARLAWEDPRLCFVVREPFQSRHSGIALGGGVLNPGQSLVIESLMPSGGVIFGDGVEADYLQFNAGATAELRAADQCARLVSA